MSRKRVAVGLTGELHAHFDALRIATVLALRARRASDGALLVFDTFVFAVLVVDGPEEEFLACLARIVRVSRCVLSVCRAAHQVIDPQCQPLAFSPHT